MAGDDVNAALDDATRRRFDLQLFADDDEGERTEEPTPRRRQKAREEGQVVRSAELVNALALFALAVALTYLVPTMMAQLTTWTRSFWAAQLAVAADDGLSSMTEVRGAASLLNAAVLSALRVALPITALAMAVGLAAWFAQTQLALSLRALQPMLSRLNPLEGLKRIFSRHGLVESLKALAKLVVIGVIAYLDVRARLLQVPGLFGAAPEVITNWLLGAAGQLFLKVAAAWLLLAAGDYAFQRWEMERSLRMTKQAVLRENKEQEGDPAIRSRRQRRQRELVLQRMLLDVAKASVVIVNPTHVAVALRYEPKTMAAPVVVARGVDATAQRIRQIAWRHDVPIMQDPPLARSLYAGTRVGEAIPEHLYQAVAQILAWVWQLERRGEL